MKKLLTVMFALILTSSLFLNRTFAEDVMIGGGSVGEDGVTVSVHSNGDAFEIEVGSRNGAVESLVPEEYKEKVTKITVAEGVTSIYDFDIAMCEKLTEIVLPDSLEHVDYYSDVRERDFYLEENGVFYLGPAENPHLILYRCGEDVKGDLVIPEGVDIIANSAFSNVVLDSLTLPEGVRTIETFAFVCASIGRISIPDSVEKVGIYALEFYVHPEYNEYEGCLYLGNEDNPYALFVKAKSYDIKETTIHPDTKCGADWEDVHYSGTADPDKKAPECAFDRCASLEKVTIPEGVKSLGIASFANCSSLKEVSIPSSMKNVQPSMFANCTSLESVTIPEGVQIIDESAFDGCVALKNVSFPSSLKKICELAFSDCSSLERITLNEGLKELVSGAFLNCRALKYLYIPKSVEKIDLYAFDSCDSLEVLNYGGSEEDWNRIAFTYAACGIEIGDRDYIEKMKGKNIEYGSAPEGEEPAKSVIWIIPLVTAVAIAIGMLFYSTAKENKRTGKE